MSTIPRSVALFDRGLTSYQVYQEFYEALMADLATGAITPAQSKRMAKHAHANLKAMKKTLDGLARLAALSTKQK